jgi:hypothetical protein
MYNDPTDQRIEAAHHFVDSLQTKSPQSEVGVIVFWKQTKEHSPMQLATEGATGQIHEWIEEASCEASESGLVKNSATASVKNTYLGNAIQAGLNMADTNYLSNVSRHIILLTDGGWDDVSDRNPQTIFDAYQSNYPDRPIPKIHGVFISDSLLHIMHGYPPEGCSDTVLIDRTLLHNITQLTNGIYIPNATPQSIVNDLLSLLDNVTGVATPPPDINGSNYHAQPDAVFTIHTSVDNRSIECSLHLPQPDHVRISIYSISGNLIAVPAVHYKNAGESQYSFDGRDLADGCYFVRCEVGTRKFSKKLTILH